MRLVKLSDAPRNHVIRTLFEVTGSNHERGMEDVTVLTGERELVAMRLRGIGYKRIKSQLSSLVEVP